MVSATVVLWMPTSIELATACGWSRRASRAPAYPRPRLSTHSKPVTMPTCCR